ncbi:hypothetical protein ABPG72_019125 [Tetrahymena utriculariae]
MLTKNHQHEILIVKRKVQKVVSTLTKGIKETSKYVYQATKNVIGGANKILQKATDGINYVNNKLGKIKDYLLKETLPGQMFQKCSNYIMNETIVGQGIQYVQKQIEEFKNYFFEHTIIGEGIIQLKQKFDNTTAGKFVNSLKPIVQIASFVLGGVGGAIQYMRQVYSKYDNLGGQIFKKVQNIDGQVYLKQSISSGGFAVIQEAEEQYQNQLDQQKKNLLDKFEECENQYKKAIQEKEDQFKNLIDQEKKNFQDKFQEQGNQYLKEIQEKKEQLKNQLDQQKKNLLDIFKEQESQYNKAIQEKEDQFKKALTDLQNEQEYQFNKKIQEEEENRTSNNLLNYQLNQKSLELKEVRSLYDQANNKSRIISYQLNFKESQTIQEQQKSRWIQNDNEQQINELKSRNNYQEKQIQYLKYQLQQKENQMNRLNSITKQPFYQKSDIGKLLQSEKYKEQVSSKNIINSYINKYSNYYDSYCKFKDVFEYIEDDKFTGNGIKSLNSFLANRQVLLKEISFNKNQQGSSHTIDGILKLQNQNNYNISFQIPERSLFGNKQNQYVVVRQMEGELRPNETKAYQLEGFCVDKQLPWPNQSDNYESTSLKIQGFNKNTTQQQVWDKTG